MIISIGIATLLFVGALLWGMGGIDDPLGHILGVFGPPILAVLGVILGIIALVKRRRAFIYPLAAIVLSVIVWLIAGLIVTG